MHHAVRNAEYSLQLGHSVMQSNRNSFGGISMAFGVKGQHFRPNKSKKLKDYINI